MPSNEGRPVWMFMAATAMATTVSTLAATAMVEADSPQPVAVTCDCGPSASEQAVMPAAAPALARQAAAEPELATEPEASAEPRQAEPAPVVEQANAKVEGALDKDIIVRIVRAHINEVRYCYNEGLARDPDLAGRVAVQLTIAPSGEVPVAAVVDSSLEDDGVEQCIAGAVKRWMFPKPPGGGNVVVTYPFVLEPG